MKKSRAQLVIAGALAICGLGIFLAVRAWLFVDLPSLDTLPDRLAVPSSEIRDRNGRLLYEIIDPNGGGHTPVPLSRIPDYCQTATIAVEDSNFYHHPGVDLYGIMRAVWINIQGGETLAGGSTITQQVARNLLLSPEEAAQRILTRKLRESILAWRLARNYSRDEILELYLNQTFYGNLSIGIDAAARTLFNKPSESLDLAECAMLAGLPQAPSFFDPLSNPSTAKEKQAIVLDLMAKKGEITSGEAERAKEEILTYASISFPIHAPHFVSYVWNSMENQLGTDVIRAGGLVVTTTLDLELQETGEQILQRHIERLQSSTPDHPARNVHNGALIALDPITGEVLAMVGSPDFFDSAIAGAVNATLSPRQPGSALKPFTYAASFNQPDPWSPSTVLLDIRTDFPTREGTPYVPLNYDRTFHGPVSIRQALAASYNVPAVKALQTIGVDTLIQLLRDLGLTTLENADRFGLALTLGGGEVRLLELTAAYGALANGGYRVEPIMIQEISRPDRDGIPQNDTLEIPDLFPSRTSVYPIIDPKVAWLITDILADDSARSPSFGRGSVLDLSRPSAVKTGTTTDWRDNWTIGYTPNLVTGVWVGNADNSPMQDISGVTGAGPIWHDFMETALLSQPAQEFHRPEGLVQADVCAISGKLPSYLCPHRSTDWFIEGTLPDEIDDWYQLFKVDRSTGLLADDSTPTAQVAERVFLVLPPELEEWARDQGIPSPPPSAQIVEGGSGEPKELLIITNPDNGVVYRISQIIPLNQQQIRFSAISHIPLLDVEYYLNGQPLSNDVKSGNPSPEQSRNSFYHYWQLEAGSFQLVVVGKTQENIEIHSNPIHFEVLAPGTP